MAVSYSANFLNVSRDVGPTTGNKIVRLVEVVGRSFSEKKALMLATYNKFKTFCL